MRDVISELKTIHADLEAFREESKSPAIAKPLNDLKRSAETVGKSWGHSWFGYQSRVYYKELIPPPPGAHFSSEWGFTELYTQGTRGEWQEFPEGAVEKEIHTLAGSPNLDIAIEAAERGKELFEQRREDLLSILQTVRVEARDPFIETLLEEAEKLQLITGSVYIEALRPSGTLMSRDTIALTQGLWTPPHFVALAQVFDCQGPALCCESLSKIVRKAFSHLERSERSLAKTERIGTNVFIGHGRSKEWKDLKDFIQDRMRLPWDEFNRVSVAGLSNVERLSNMLDAAAIAFLVMTAEDERSDRKLQARMNVVHEAGLFQGRLAFGRAIIMLEDGCEEFSNINGLGQIRFPNGNIKAAFHDVQLVLEREGLIEPPDEGGP
jgi:predicted nucleotide-binding protein